MEIKEEYVNSLAAELKVLSTQIDFLTAMTESVAAHVRVKYIHELNGLHAKQQVAAEEMEDLQEAGDNRWEVIQVTADKLSGGLEVGLSSSKNIVKIVTDGYHFWDDIELG